MLYAMIISNCIFKRTIELSNPASTTNVVVNEYFFIRFHILDVRTNGIAFISKYQIANLF
jgi:hypothetical protein